MDARALRDKLAAKELDVRAREFIAPYNDQSKKAIVKIDKVVYPFRIVGQQGSGFGVFKPVDGTCARFVADAPFERMREYLDILPQIHFILSFEIESGWAGYPMNMESATKSLGLLSEAVVRNVSDCERFDVVVARFDGDNFWYDEIFVGGDPAKSQEMRECFRKGLTPTQMKALFNKVKAVTPADRKAFDLAMTSWAQFQAQSTEARVKHLLEAGGAHLTSYVLRGAGIEVRWRSESGERYTSLVDKSSLDVVSAGICLTDEDHKFHLKDLPHVMREGEERGAIYRTRFERDFAREHARDLAMEENDGD